MPQLHPAPSRRRAAALLPWIPLALIAGLSACSKGVKDAAGLENIGPSVPTNGNVQLGLELGLSTPDLQCWDVQGARMPLQLAGDTTALAEGDEDISLVLFTTSAPASTFPDATVNDDNTGSDVFLAAVSSRVSNDTFVNTLANKFRHPRCVTCHAMTSTTDPLDAFANHPGGAPPLGGEGRPPNEGTCKECHQTPDWRAPLDLDFRGKTYRELYDQALAGFDTPEQLLEHLTADPRTGWATGDRGLAAPEEPGIIRLGGGVADDDYDGIVEVRDLDGTPRLPPGGRQAFVDQSTRWTNRLAEPGSTAIDADDLAFSDASEAILDLTLVSVNQAGTATGNGPSGSPRFVFVANPDFATDPPDSDRLFGSLYVAYASQASDLTADTDNNGSSDIFLSRVDVTVTANGAGVELSVEQTTAISVDDNAGDQLPASGGSFAPDLWIDPSDSDGIFVAFESEAGLSTAFVDGNGSARDVFLRDVRDSTTRLVSADSAGGNQGGSGASGNVSLSREAFGLAFESDSIDFDLADGDMDTNGARDVFFTTLALSPSADLRRASRSTAGAEGTGGSAHEASIHVSSSSDLASVAFESTHNGLADDVPSNSTQAYLHQFDGSAGTTRWLNVSQDRGVRTIGAANLGGETGVGVAESFHPEIGPDGRYVAFSSQASNIDVLRPQDENDAADVFLVDILETGLRPFRVSLDIDGGDANGDSGALQPGQRLVLGALDGSEGFPVGLVSYPTQATNLPIAESPGVVVGFLMERPTRSVDFDADPRIGPLTFDPEENADVLAVQFTDMSSGDPVAWAWDFGDETTSSEQNPMHKYRSADSFDVSLTVTYDDGEERSLTLIAFVAAFDGTPTPTFDPPMGELLDDIAFQGDSDQPAETFVWNFGDGSDEVEGQNVSHAFRESGDFEVTLTATNSFGSNSVTRTVTVDPTSFRTVQDRLFEMSFPGGSACTTCHFSGGQVPNLREDVDGDGSTYARIIGVYIQPNDLAGSLLYQRMISIGAPMPPTGPIPDDELMRMESWILDGAPPD